jgi:hypothetical protein
MHLSFFLSWEIFLFVSGDPLGAVIMAHRDNRSMTGSNTIPLGGGMGGIKSVSRAAMGGGGESLLNPSYLTLPNIKRECK